MGADDMSEIDREPVTTEIQRAEVSLMLTRDMGWKATAEITNRGLLSVAVLVSSILLSTAVLVHVAARSSRR
jgi:hypothetical protein